MRIIPFSLDMLLLSNVWEINREGTDRMLDFIKKSPLGILLAVGAIILVLSPEARQAAHNLGVKCTTAILDLKEKMQNEENVPQAQIAESLSEYQEPKQGT